MDNLRDWLPKLLPVELLARFAVRTRCNALCRLTEHFESENFVFISDSCPYEKLILICSFSAKHTPFNIQFLTDHIEMQNEALVDNNGTPKTGSGFQLAFFMRASDC